MQEEKKAEAADEKKNLAQSFQSLLEKKVD